MAAVEQCELNNRIVAAWISISDYNLLRKIAQANNVTVSTYVRGIIVDAVQDELSPTITINTKDSKLRVVNKV